MTYTDFTQCPEHVLLHHYLSHSPATPLSTPILLDVSIYIWPNTNTAKADKFDCYCYKLVVISFKTCKCNKQAWERFYEKKNKGEKIRQNKREMERNIEET